MKETERPASNRFTSSDLEAFPDDGKRYEIIGGELYVSKAPQFQHQLVCTLILSKLHQWCEQSGNGRAVVAPGVIFADDDDVIPDVVWLSSRRMSIILWPDGKLHAAPELIIEVLSPGSSNEKRDRETKLTLYSRRGVDEYWIVDWQLKTLQTFRRLDAQLVLAATLAEFDTLTTPLLQGFACRVGELFAGVPSPSGQTT